MKANPKSESASRTGQQSPEGEGALEERKAESGEPGTTGLPTIAPQGESLVMRPGLAAALKVSVSTIDRMVKSEDLPCVRLRGRVRFYLPCVVVALCKGDRKFGRHADTNFTNWHQGGQAS